MMLSRTLINLQKIGMWNQRTSVVRSSCAISPVKHVEAIRFISSGEAILGEETKDSSRYETIKVTFKEGVRTIIHNRPNKKNALSEKMFQEVPLALEEAAADPKTVITCTTGAGNVYCAGNDLDNFKTISMTEIRDLLTGYFSALIDFPKPLVALVNGAAVGGGATVLPLYDIVFASEKAIFFTPFSALDITAEGCSSFTFPRLMGQAKASEILYFNKKVSAQEAKILGLVTEVLPSGTFLQDAQPKLLSMAQLPLKSLVYSKELSRQPIKETLHKVNVEECKRVTERLIAASQPGRSDYEQFIKENW